MAADQAAHPFVPQRDCIPPSASIREAMQILNENQIQIVLVVDEERRLLGTIVDGDIRRAVLANLSLVSPVSQILAAKNARGAQAAVVGEPGLDRAAMLQVMLRHGVKQLPLVDEGNRIIGLVTLEELLPSRAKLSAVVMAGGFGKRLMPLTEQTPKPMLPVGGKPILEHIVRHLSQHGIEDVTLTTHYRGDQIVSHFGTGEKFGVNIDYINEDEPLGTAGALGKMKRPSGPILVMNGDILTDLNSRALLDFHHEAKADLTVAVQRYEMAVPFGVVETDGSRVIGIREKPGLNFLVSSGIYLVEPRVWDLILPGQKLDMPDLIQRILDSGRTVASFPICEYWIDVGRMDEYQRAMREHAEKGG